MVIFRIEACKAEMEQHSNSSIYNAIRVGLFTKPVPIGQRSVDWPDYEVKAINQAQIEMWSEDDSYCWICCDSGKRAGVWLGFGKIKNVPTTAQESGAGEQLSLFPAPLFRPISPPSNTAYGLALVDLLTRDLTQPDWLEMGRGWRLAAAINKLNYLGWCIISTRVKYKGRSHKIVRYSLSEEAKQAAHAMLGSAASA